jgi:5-methylcytosine-specific restriction endonuclease McrA
MEDDLRRLMGDPCAYCGEPAENGIDHITAVIRGGSSHWENLTACCLKCNKLKGTKQLLQFLLKRDLNAAA